MVSLTPFAHTELPDDLSKNEALGLPPSSLDCYEEMPPYNFGWASQIYLWSLSFLTNTAQLSPLSDLVTGLASA